MLYNKSIILLLCIVIFGCVSENAENLYPSNDAEANLFYTNNLQTIIENKCISCHIYHLEGANRYDTYEKTKSNINQMISRIDATSNIVMPPADEEQLTIEEKNAFYDFLNILDGAEDGGNTEIKPIQVTWTAYKYPDFNDRAPVSGTFDTILEYELNPDPKTPIDILDNAMVIIDASSVNVGNEEQRTKNVGAFFVAFTSQIKGQISSYTSDKATITFTMNGIEQQVELDITEEAEKIILNGSLEDMNLFNWQNGYQVLENLCGVFHQNKLWPDVKISIEISTI